VPQRPRQFPQARRDRRLDVVVVQLRTLDTQQPRQVQQPSVTAARSVRGGTIEANRAVRQPYDRGGSGLGLPIADGVASAHGGDLVYTGTAFVLTLPLHPALPADPAQTADTSPAST
jgi:hypothetical protein